MAKYYVICEDDCRYEGMTKEQILASIEQALEQGYVSDPDKAVFSKIKEICAGDAIQLWVGSQAEFNAINPAPNTGRAFVRVGANGIVYLCPDDDSADAFESHLRDANNPHNVKLEQLTNGRTLASNYYDKEVKTNGRWINGQPIYQKTIRLSKYVEYFTKNGTKNYDATIEDIQHVIGIEGFAVISSIDGITTARTYKAINDGNIIVSVNAVSKKIIVTTTQDITAAEVCVTLRYTKSTDPEIDDFGPETGLDNVILA